MIKSVYYYNIAAHCTVFFLLIGFGGELIKRMLREKEGHIGKLCLIYIKLKI